MLMRRKLPRNKRKILEVGGSGVSACARFEEWVSMGVHVPAHFRMNKALASDCVWLDRGQ